MKILTIPGSNSSTSINAQLAEYIGRQLDQADVTNFRLSEVDIPLYSPDLEKAGGIPNEVEAFNQLILSSDGIILSLAEHNGSFSAAFKNLYDWASRTEMKVWQGKPMLLAGTSPGGRGAKSVIEHAHALFSRQTSIAGPFSLPSFYDAFNTESGLTKPEDQQRLDAAIKQFNELLS